MTNANIQQKKQIETFAQVYLSMPLLSGEINHSVDNIIGDFDQEINTVTFAGLGDIALSEQNTSVTHSIQIINNMPFIEIVGTGFIESRALVEAKVKERSLELSEQSNSQWQKLLSTINRN